MANDAHNEFAWSLARRWDCNAIRRTHTSTHIVLLLNMLTFVFSTRTVRNPLLSRTMIMGGSVRSRAFGVRACCCCCFCCRSQDTFTTKLLRFYGNGHRHSRGRTKFSAASQSHPSDALHRLKVERWLFGWRMCIWVQYGCTHAWCASKPQMPQQKGRKQHNGDLHLCAAAASPAAATAHQHTNAARIIYECSAS